MKDTAGDKRANTNMKQLLGDFLELQTKYGIIVNFLRWDNSIVAVQNYSHYLVCEKKYGEVQSHNIC